MAQTNRSRKGIPNRPKLAPISNRALVKVTHGAHTPAVYRPIAEALLAWLAEQRPDLAAYPIAVSRWAIAEARAALMHAYLERVGMYDENDEPRETVLKLTMRFEAEAAKYAGEIGLTPATHAALVKDRADATKATWSVDDAVASVIANAKALSEGESDDAGG